ncbi:MAG: sterol desaturase family protein [Opitutales bacterium]
MSISLTNARSHHSNVRVPARLDRALRCVIVTPRIHWVHPSDYLPETDSNYSSVFSWWDRLFRSFRLRKDPGTLRLGLKGYERNESQRLDGMLLSQLVWKS